MKLQSAVSGPLQDSELESPLLLVGGGLTGWASWEPHQKLLAVGRRVARVQPLSVQMGLEDRPVPPGYSVGMESEALARTIDALTWAKPIDVVGWSYGGAIALDFALNHMAKIRTLTLIEPPCFWVLDETGADPAVKRESEEMRALYASMKVEVTERQLAEFIRGAGLCPPGTSPTQMDAWPEWVKHRRSLRIGEAAWEHEDRLERLQEFNRPVLLIKGRGSSPSLHKVVDGLGATLPRVDVLELPGGHAPQIAARDEFLSYLERFHAQA